MIEATVEMSPKEKFLSHYGMIDFSFDKPSFLEKRESAKAQLEQLEMPTSKTEYWKYTRIAKLIKPDYMLGEQEMRDELDLSVPAKNCLVFINGYYSEELSWTECEEGILFMPLSQSKENVSSLSDKFDSLRKENEIFSTINTAYHQDGVFFHASKGKMTEEVYYVINISAGEQALSNPRHFIQMDEASSAKLVIKNLSSTEGYSFSNQLMEVFVAPNANLEINKIQDAKDEAYLISNEEVEQAGNSQFKMNTISLSGSLIRNNLNIDLRGSHAESWMNGMSLLDGKEHVDHHTMIHHREPNCDSHELYKTIADDCSTGVFNGKVHVHSIAQKTNAYQSNANIVLTDNASINSKPELEIYADDVKCSHGSTTGQLDEEATFYLRSRGVSESSARKMLIKAFVFDILEEIELESFRNYTEELVEKKFKL